jgi:hypothetical protein
MFRKFFDSMVEKASEKAAKTLADEAKKAVSQRVERAIGSFLPAEEAPAPEAAPRENDSLAAVVAERKRRDAKEEAEAARRAKEAEQTRLRAQVAASAARKQKEEQDIDDELAALKKRIAKP